MKKENASPILKYAKLSQKGQITVPREIREILGVQLGEKIVFYVDETKQVKIINADKVQVKL